MTKTFVQKCGNMLVIESAIGNLAFFVKTHEFHLSQSSQGMGNS